MRRSIRVRLLAAILLLIVPLSLAAAWLLVEVFASRTQRDVDVALEEEAETLATLIGSDANLGSLAVLLDRIARERDLGADKQVAILRRGELVGESPPGALRRLGSAASELRIARAGAPGDPIEAIIGVRANLALRARQRLTLLLGVGVPGLLMLLAAGLWVVTGRALKPLEEASDQVGRISGSNLAARVSVATSNDEIGRMVAVLNAMLQRLEISVLELQRFTADAAHELRTPLAILRTGLEVSLGRERSLAEYRAALEDALAGTERLARLAEDMLTLARLDAVGALHPSVPLSLSEMLHELADAWTPLAEKREFSVAVEAPADLWTRGDEGDLYRLFNNLIANAIAHSPPGGRVSVTAEARGASAWIAVTDQGAGIAAGEVDRVFDRFYRGDSARMEAGSGLGLSIARTIARAHGGEIALGNLPTGGCRAEVLLPNAPPGPPPAVQAT